MRERQERRRCRAAARAVRRQCGVSAARRGVRERQEQQSGQRGAHTRRDCGMRERHERRRGQRGVHLVRETRAPAEGRLNN